jgi:hypothetical protein
MASDLRLKSRCPRCQSPNVRTSRFRGWEHMGRLVLLRPYRCRWCLARFMRPFFWTGRPLGRPSADLTVEHLLRTPFPD